MKKLSVLLSAVFLLAAACNKQPVPQNQASHTGQPPVQSQTQQSRAASWKTYTDAKASFTIDYPSSWAAVADNTTASTDPVSGRTTYFGQVKLAGAEGTINIVFGGGFGGGLCSVAGGNLETIKLGTTSASVCRLPDNSRRGSCGDCTGVVHDGTSFSVNFQPTSEASQGLISQILSTFKFTQPSLDLNSIFDLKDKETGTQIYYSDKLGVGFTYLNPANTTFKVAVTEIGDKIYIHGTHEKPQQGKYVEVFTKDPSASLEAAITSTLLKSYSDQDCFAVSNSTYAKRMESSSTLVSGEISYPIPANADLEQIQPYFDKCPTQYARTNGLRYFLMDTNHPNKFLFVDAGQDVIASDGTPQNSAKGFYGFAWEQSIKVLK